MTGAKPHGCSWTERSSGSLRPSGPTIEAHSMELTSALPTSLSECLALSTRLVSRGHITAKSSRYQRSSSISSNGVEGTSNRCCRGPWFAEWFVTEKTRFELRRVPSAADGSASSRQSSTMETTGMMRPRTVARRSCATLGSLTVGGTELSCVSGWNFC